MSEISTNDALSNLVVTAANWIKNNRNMFFSIAASVAGILILAIFLLSRFHMMSVRSSEKLAIAQNLMSNGQMDQSNNTLDEIINNYPRTGPAVHARLIKADYLLHQRKFSEAEALLKPVLENNNNKKILPLVLSYIGTIQEESGKYDEAIKTYNTFLDKYPQNMMAPKIHESAARLYELTGAIPQAKSEYEKIIALYPASGWANRAQEKISKTPGTR